MSSSESKAQASDAASAAPVGASDAASASAPVGVDLLGGDSDTLQTVSSSISFAADEEQVSKYWSDIDAFRKSVQLSLDAQRPRYTFYDGPPFATGLPHYGHILAGTIKDTVTRYAHQTGHYVERRFGWDTHGLPVEYEIDKKLGVKSSADVEKMGIKKYNEECRSIVMRYSKEWQTVVTRMGRWIDFDNDYKTLDTSFMESVWWVFAELNRRGLVYRGFKVMPYSTACHTPLSNFETSPDCYKMVDDPAVVVTLPLVNDPNVKLTAWTTTPWTLPSNMALCVNESMEYVKLKDTKTGDVYIMAKERITQLYEEKSSKKKKKKKKKKSSKKDDDLAGATANTTTSTSTSAADANLPPYTIIETLTGKDLVGLEYEPLFDTLPGHTYRVVSDDYVTSESGTGVVHQAPAFGEDDYRVCLREGIIQKDGALFCPVDGDGNFTDEVKQFAGRYVKEADRDIIRLLQSKGRLIQDKTFKHSYPHCWRSDTPLIYKAVPSWFIDVPQLKERLLVNNDKTYWVPDFVKSKRFHNWLSDARPWSVSRERFWGTPLPVWVSDDGKEVEFVESIAQLEQRTGVTGITDLHRDNIDHLTMPSKRGEEYGVLRRVPQVFDCWFESGSMPYAQVHYPFENKESFEQNFPADFIAEGLDQTRGWFYTLMVISTALFDKPPFKNLIVNGLVLASDGKKMSKRLKNYPDPLKVVHRHSADALRVYLINSPVVRAEPLRFMEDGVRDVVRSIFIPWFNTYRLFVDQARRLERVEHVKFQVDHQVYKHTDNTMDKWIMASLQSLIEFVHTEMKGYRLYTVAPKLINFVVDMSNWYVRFNKGRIKGDDGAEQAQFALATMYEVLFALCRLMAPFTPFLVEQMYLNLRRVLPADSDLQSESVHFLMLPDKNEDACDADIERKVSVMQSVIESGFVARAQCDFSMRTPTPDVVVVHRDAAVLADIKELSGYIADQLRAHQVRVSDEVHLYGRFVASPDRKALGQRLKTQMRVVTERLFAMTSEEVEQLEAKGSVEFADLGVTVDKSEVEVSWEFAGDATQYSADVSAASGCMVLINRVPNEACIEEGLCREFTSSVQRLRKSSNLHIEDEIDVYYSLDAQDAPALAAALANNGDLIHSVIGVRALPIASKPESDALHATEETEINGEKYSVHVAHAHFCFDDAKLTAKFGDAATAATAKQAALAFESENGRATVRRLLRDNDNKLSVGDYEFVFGDDTFFTVGDLLAATQQ
jgi:isoleucyl-tRNA synthetase